MAYIADTYTAYFEPDADVLIQYKVAGTGGSVTPESESISPVATVAQGSTAKSADGYKLLYWTDSNGDIVGKNNFFQPPKGEDGIFHAATYYASFAHNDKASIVYFADNGDTEFRGKVTNEFEEVAGDEPANGSKALVAPGYHFVK